MEASKAKPFSVKTVCNPVNKKVFGQTAAVVRGPTAAVVCPKIFRYRKFYATQYIAIRPENKSALSSKVCPVKAVNPFYVNSEILIVIQCNSRCNRPTMKKSRFSRKLDLAVFFCFRRAQVHMPSSRVHPREPRDN